MPKYIVIWIQNGFNKHEHIDIIDNINNEQEAVDKVRRLHKSSIILTVGILSNEWE